MIAHCYFRNSFCSTELKQRLIQRIFLNAFFSIQISESRALTVDCCFLGVLFLSSGLIHSSAVEIPVTAPWQILVGLSTADPSSLCWDFWSSNSCSFLVSHVIHIFVTKAIVSSHKSPPILGGLLKRLGPQISCSLDCQTSISLGCFSCVH